MYASIPLFIEPYYMAPLMVKYSVPHITGSYGDVGHFLIGGVTTTTIIIGETCTFYISDKVLYGHKTATFRVRLHFKFINDIVGKYITYWAKLEF